MVINLEELSIAEIDKIINVLKSKKGELFKLNSPDQLSRKDRFKKMFDACQGIIDTDISRVYDSLSLNEDKIYYVYAHLDPSKSIAIGNNAKSTFAATFGMKYRPIYIGKGIGDRYLDLNRNETHRKIRQKLKSCGKDLIPFKIKEGLSEKEALCLESKFIDIFGVIGKTGTLVNLDEGVNAKERQKYYANHLCQLSSMFEYLLHK
jgi:hypothetical protein